MYTKRIIPCLDVKNGRVVKGTNFVGLRDAGDPVELAHRYDLERCDELVFLDITASNEQRDTIVQVARDCASQVFIPFTIGGGIRTTEDMRKMLKAGADKTSVNTAAVKNPDLIRQGAEKFGRQCIVLAVDARRNGENSWEVYVNGGRTPTGLDVIEWVKKATELGAGEILLMSVDNEGLQQGCDLELIRAVTEAVSIPVVCGGGVGCAEDILDAARAGADAVACAAVLHYGKATVPELKQEIRAGGVEVRL